MKPIRRTELWDCLLGLTMHCSFEIYQKIKEGLISAASSQMECRSGDCINIVIYHVNDYRHLPTLYSGSDTKTWHGRATGAQHNVSWDGFTLNECWHDPKPFYKSFFFFFWKMYAFFPLNVILSDYCVSMEVSDPNGKPVISLSVSHSICLVAL